MSHENWLTPHEKVWIAHVTGRAQHEIWLIPHDNYYATSDCSEFIQVLEKSFCLRKNANLLGLNLF
jgi:hypothetical protein